MRIPPQLNEPAGSDAKLARIAVSAPHRVHDALGHDFLDQVRLAGVMQRPRRALEGVTHDAGQFGPKAAS
jgi:hypothetical protein